MNNSTAHNEESPARETNFKSFAATLWQRLKSKRISYFTLPLIVMATLTEFVILATGWKYQQVVCLPNGMGVTFFGIGPIGATILAVELLKLPLAVWTASRTGWQKGFMVAFGLPLICVLTFQLVKDMAVYEMGVAMTPASQYLEKASAEEIKIAQLNGELKAIEQKKADRDRKLAELAEKKAKTKAEIEESLKRNQESRQDAITLTDYQRKELSEVEARQAAIIKQFDADTDQLTKSLADLRARREKELSRATEWNAEEARIENEYKQKMALYTNIKSAYDKAKSEYENANVFKRQLMKEPVSPGVPPEREVNKLLKPTVIAELDTQIKAKEAELASVNTRRRDRVAQVSDDARRLREEFDRRSTTKRDASDQKRDELTASLAAMTQQWAAEQKGIEQDYESAAQKTDSIREEADAARKRANSFYEARESAIKNTQVHRIATTVEIVRGLIFGQRPVSVTASAKERGDLYTDQISMVRVWVYPALAFIVAFLPTLMVEIGFSTLFHPEKTRPPHRLGFLGRGLHWLYKRAGRVKILRAERLAREATAAITTRDRALAAEKAAAAHALAAKDGELQAANQALADAGAKHADALKRLESEWVEKLADTTDSLNRALAEKDALRDLQKSEVERLVQLRQNAWSERVSQLTQEIDALRSAAENERVALRQEQQKRLAEITEQGKAQSAELRRKLAEAELAAMETTSKLSHDLKEALHARDQAESQLAFHSEAAARQAAQLKEEASREVEKAVRQERLRAERQQQEFEKTLRQREADLELRSRQREQELLLGMESRFAEEKNQFEQDARRRVAQVERDAESRVRELEARWKQEVQRREEAAQLRLTQREQQLQALIDGSVQDAQAQAEQELRRRTADFERQLEAQARDAEARFRNEAQQREISFQTRSKQREQQLQAQFESQLTEAQAKWQAEAQARDQELQRNIEAAARSTESRWVAEIGQREELFQSKLRQRDQQWQSKLEAAQTEARAQAEQEFRRRESAAAEGNQRSVQALEEQLRKELQSKREACLSEAKQREQELLAQIGSQSQQHATARKEWSRELEKLHGTIEPLKVQLSRVEQERDAAVRAATESADRLSEMETKMTEATSLLSGRKAAVGKNGNGTKPSHDRQWTDARVSREEF